jgi:ABC-type phosphate transport system substrate-binding protein
MVQGVAKMRKLITAASMALALTAAPIAQAGQAERASAPVEQASEIGGSSTLLYLLLAVLLSGVVSIGDIFGDDDDPDSP